MSTPLKKKKKVDVWGTIITILFALVCVMYVMPIVMVAINSFKENGSINTDTFALPNKDTFMGFDNYVKGMTFGNYPFWKSLVYSLLITVVSQVLSRAGREDIAALSTLAGLIVVLMMVMNMVSDFFSSIRAMFDLA